MKRNHMGRTLTYIILTFLLVYSGCEKKSVVRLNHNYSESFTDIKLGDGECIQVEVLIKYEITERFYFRAKYKSLDRYDTLIMKPKCRELISTVMKTYSSSDSLKLVLNKLNVSLENDLTNGLMEKGIRIIDIKVWMDNRFSLEQEDTAKLYSLNENEQLTITPGTRMPGVAFYI